MDSNRKFHLAVDPTRMFVTRTDCRIGWQLARHVSLDGSEAQTWMPGERTVPDIEPSAGLGPCAQHPVAVQPTFTG